MSSNEYSYNKEKQNFKRKSPIKIGQKLPKNRSKRNSSINIQDELKKALVPKFTDLILNIINKENEKNNLGDEEFNMNRERQLEILVYEYEKIYRKKDNNYENIIAEIDSEQKLIYKRSLKSFELLILKIKFYIRLLKEKFESNLKLKDERNYYEVDLYIQKVKNEFIKIYLILDENNKYEYEILIQNYCKFLFLISIICTRKEEFIKSFGYISLGVNMLKVFFLRQNIARDIETYKIYAKLIIILINKLISDNNINLSLIYINLLSRICEVALNIIYKHKLKKRYENKFNKYLGYNFLLLGYCFELNNKLPDKYEITEEAYKQAYYFFYKSFNKSYIFASHITIDRKCLYLSQLLLEKLKEKIIAILLEKERKSEINEKLKKKLIKEAKYRDKKYKLKLISNGFVPHRQNLVKTQRKIDTEILNPFNQKLIDVLDNEIISYVYKDNKSQNNKKKLDNIKIKLNPFKKEKSEKILPSIEVMKNLCHYKIYEYLMKNDLKEFISNNERLEFNNPEQEKNSLYKLQKYLNHKMEIKNNIKTTNTEISINKENNNCPILKTEENICSETLKNKILDLKDNNTKDKKYKLLEISSYKNGKQNNLNVIKSKNYSSRNKKHLTPLNTNYSFIYSKNKEQNNSYKNLNKKYITFTNYITSVHSETENSNENIYNKNKFNSKMKLTYKNRDLDNRRFDKSIFSHRYFKESQYFEKLINKELEFQKKFLGLKNSNSKMYFKGFNTDYHNIGKISKEEIDNSFLMLHDKAIYKEKNYVDEMKINKIEFKNKLVVGNVFKSVTNKIKEGKEIKSAMRKVLDRYISERKRDHLRKSISMITIQDINKFNNNSIIKLNNNIKELNLMLTSKNNETKKNKNYINCFK